MLVKVKICGITNLKDALKAVELGADALGFVFYRKSPRYISPFKAKRIISKIPPFIECVGVFVDEKKEFVKKILRFCKINVLQFHGRESPTYCDSFKGYKVIKAFRVGADFDVFRLLKYKVDAILLDTFLKNTPGGTGRSFDWRIALEVKKYTPFLILSGGLNIENIGLAINKVAPYAVDVCSGVEKSPGRKDYTLMREFIKKAKETNAL